MTRLGVFLTSPGPPARLRPSILEVLRSPTAVRGQLAGGYRVRT